jgi:DNA polymerase-3 subunit beta
MKFTIPAKQLSTALNQAKNVVQARSPIPVLSTVLLDATKTGLRLTGASPDSRIEIGMQCDVAEPGKLLLPHQLLAQGIGHFDGDVRCEIDGVVATLSAGKLRLRLNGLAPDEFPLAPEFKPERTFEIPFAELKHWLARLSPFMAVPALGRVNLEAILLEGLAGKLMIVAADGYRLAIADTGIETGGAAFQCAIPAPSIRTILALDSDQTARVSVSDALVMIESGPWKFWTHLLALGFPNWQQIQQIAQSEMKLAMCFDREEAIRALQFSSVTLDENRRAYVSAVKDEVAFATAGNAVGDSAAVIGRKDDGPAFKFVVDLGKFKDVLNACEEQEVTITSPDNISPLVIREPSFLSITSPMRIAPANPEGTAKATP